jgi:hypothetical protein
VARPAGANVHVGKAAALIVVSLALGFFVLNDNSSGGFRAAASPHVSVPDVSDFTETTVHSNATTTTAAAAERAAKDIKVIAINATGRAGQGAAATTRLRSAGYDAVAPGNATAAVTNSHPVSAVYIVTPGYNKEALTVAALFHLPDSAVKPLPNPSPSADIRSDTNIAVLVGTGITL